MFAWTLQPIKQPREMCRAARIAGSMLLATASNLAQPAPPHAPAMDLSLSKAIQIAVSAAGDTSVQMAQEAERASAANYTEVRSTLLPALEGSMAEQDQTVNPKALGLRFESPAFTVPDSVGPFSTFDARLRLNAKLLDMSALRHRQAAAMSWQAAKSETESVRERVAAAVARLYSAALRAEEQSEVAALNLKEAEAARDLAAHRAAAGESADIEVSRANLTVAQDKQRLIEADTELARSSLQLVKILQLNWDTPLHLTSSLSSPRPETRTAAELVALALKSRAAFKVQDERIESAQLEHSAAARARLPSVVAYADYGVLAGVATYTVGAGVRVPLFDGGRIRSEKMSTESVMRQEQIRRKEIEREVELEVRQALAVLDSARQQVDVADQAIAVAQDEVGRADRRFDAGLANGLEVVDARTRLEVARYDRVTALFGCANARIDLAEATGTVSSTEF